MFKLKTINYIFLALPVFLTGCDSDELKAVKESINYSIDNTITTEQAFKTRSDCINGEWGESEDNRGRKVVTYTCELPQDTVNSIVSNLKITPFDVEHSSWSSKNREALKKRLSTDLADINANIEKINSSLPRFHELLKKTTEVFSSDPYAQSVLDFNAIASGLIYDFLEHRDQSNFYFIDGRIIMNPNNRGSYRASFDKEKIAPLIVKASPIYSEGIKNLPTIKIRGCDISESVTNNISIPDRTIQQSLDINWASFESGVQCYIKDLKKNAELISNNQSRVDSIFDNNNAKMIAFRNMYLFNKITVTSKWHVSENGGVSPINGTIEYISDSNKKTLSATPEELLSIAYSDYKPGTYPVFYERKIYSSLVMDSSKTGSQIQSF